MEFRKDTLNYILEELGEKDIQIKKIYYGEEVQMLNHQNYLKKTKDILEMILNTKI